MQTHYGFTSAQMKVLAKAGVSDLELMRFIPLFDPDSTGEPISQISLYHYIDKHGDFTTGKKPIHKKVANEIFNNFSSKQKMEVLQYLDDYDNNFKE